MGIQLLSDATSFMDFILLLQNIALEEYRLDNEARLLSLDTKTHDLENKRRLYPQSDLSHEEMSVQNLQKYLVRNIADCSVKVLSCASDIFFQHKIYDGDPLSFEDFVDNEKV